MSNSFTVEGAYGATLTLGPMFPGSIQVGCTSIKLNADGTWEGDCEAFLAALAEAKQEYSGFAMPVLWLIAHAIQNDKRGA